MDVLRKGNRLSVQPVTAEEWQTVLSVNGVDDPL
jgi:predicted RNA-binding protein with PUA-like domain